MRLKRLILNNFKAYRDVDLTFESNIDRIVLIGPNDSGKTELLNAIYWCIWGEELTKNINFPQFLNDFRSENQPLGLFNSSKWAETKEEFFKVSVKVVFELSKDEIIETDNYKKADIEIERFFYVDKADGISIYLTDPNIEEVSDFNELKKQNINKESSWPSRLILRHPTDNSNSELADDPDQYRTFYFPNKEVTKFFLLDTTLLNGYLENSQENNKKNIDSVSDVKDLNKIINNMGEITKGITTKRNTLQKAKGEEKTKFKVKQDSRDDLEHQINFLEEDNLIDLKLKQ